MADFSQPQLFETLRKLKGHEPSSFVLAVAALERGLTVTHYRDQQEAGLRHQVFSGKFSSATFYSLSDGRRCHFFNSTLSDRISATAALTTKDKLKTKAILHAKNLNTPVGGFISSKNPKLLVDLYAAGVRLFVIKPVSGSLGKDTHVGQSAQQVLAVLRGNPNAGYLLEQYIVGQEHRLFVVGRKVVGAFIRQPPIVVGNGIDTIRTLCENYQAAREHNPLFVDNKLNPAEVELALLFWRRKWTDIPRLNEVVSLAKDLVPAAQGNRSWSLDTLPQSMKQLAIDSMQALSARSGALDMVLDRSGVPFVLEVNMRPMIAALSLPWPHGEWNLHVPNAIIDDLFGPSTKPRREIATFDFAALRAEIFREGRTTKGINASDFATFA